MDFCPWLVKDNQQNECTISLVGNLASYSYFNLNNPFYQ